MAQGTPQAGTGSIPHRGGLPAAVWRSARWAAHTQTDTQTHIYKHIHSPTARRPRYLRAAAAQVHQRRRRLVNLAAIEDATAGEHQRHPLAHGSRPSGREGAAPSGEPGLPAPSLLLLLGSSSRRACAAGPAAVSIFPPVWAGGNEREDVEGE